MKVIGVDNFGRDSVADILIEDNLTAEAAEKVVSDYNDSRFTRPYWAIAVENNYKLWRGMEELV